jgi:hypothetical protein
MEMLEKRASVILISSQIETEETIVNMAHHPGGRHNQPKQPVTKVGGEGK